MALTASAPPSVQASIIDSLHLRNPVVVAGDLDRRNIFISASDIKSIDVGAISYVVTLLVIYYSSNSGICVH